MLGRAESFVKTVGYLGGVNEYQRWMLLWRYSL